MKKLSETPETATRTLLTTVQDLRPNRPEVEPDKKLADPPNLPPKPPSEKRRAPLISLFGVEIDAAAIRDKIQKSVSVVGDSALISLIINATGAAFTHYAMGVPFDLKIAAAYMVIGTLVGTLYGPVKQAVLRAADAISDGHKAGDSS